MKSCSKQLAQTFCLGLFNLPARNLNYLAGKFVAVAPWRHCGKLDKLPVRPAAALEQRPFEELSPRFRTKENHFVSKSAGRICACRQKTASFLILLPRAIIQFSSVLPRRFRPQIFCVDITSSQIEHAEVQISQILLIIECALTSYVL
jgi:hypothetical protein